VYFAAAVICDNQLAMAQTFFVAAAITVLGASVGAHDFWLSANRLSEGKVTVTGNVGEKFPVADSKTTPDRVDIWRVLGSAGDINAGRDFFQDGQSLAARVTLASPGTYLGIMTILARDIEMTGKEFTDYLREEGLDKVIDERARLGHTERSARERYARYAKIVMRTGAGDAAHVTRASGIKAELIPSANPAGLKPGTPFSVQLIVEGRPIADALLTAVSHDARLDVRTDRDGRATFTLPAAGPWLVKTVHMARPADAGEPPADWESYWVTLAFEM
jgi:hypothetical protein